MAEATGRVPRPFFSTSVPGLDEVLGGGLRVGGLYLVYGPTGSGKTILGAQVSFGVARAGGKVVIVTLISESHGKLLDHLSGFAFFDDARVGPEIVLLNAYETLKNGGPAGFLELVARLLNEHKPRLFVLEGFATLRGLGVPELDIGQFVHRLNALVTALGCAGFLIDPAPGAADNPEQTLVDGIAELTTYAREGRIVRELRVHKHRAASPLLGRSAFRITDEGLVVYPRLEEAVARRAHPAPHTQARAAFGIANLDAMMRGGLLRGAGTLVLGAAGTGKTLLALKFLEQGLHAGEKALYFGFYESPQRLLAKAEGIGMALGAPARDGTLQILWQPAVEYTLDELGYRLLDAVRAQRPRRVVVDGIDGFAQASIRPERLPVFLTALTVELRALGIDLIFTQEASPLGGPAERYVASALVENILMLRSMELRAELQRLVSIVKMRESDYDTAVRELRITPSGIDVSDSFAAP